MSRQFVWSFLHAHPFYNSEQQSQRYVRLTHASAYLPAETPGFGSAERAIYENAVARAWGYYRELTTLLQGDAREILGEIWHISPMSHPKRVQKVDRQAEKRAIEVARYVLPVAAATTMVHTISGIVLHRPVAHGCGVEDTPSRGACGNRGKWWLGFGKLTRSFSTVLTTRRWNRKKCRNSRTPHAIGPIRLTTVKSSCGNSTRASRGASPC